MNKKNISDNAFFNRGFSPENNININQRIVYKHKKIIIKGKRIIKQDDKLN